MKRIETGTSDRLGYREPCGCFVLLGLASWLLPVAVPWGLIAFGVGFDNYLRAVGPQGGGIALLVMLLFTGHYVYSVGRKYTRVGCIIDRRAGTVEAGCGFLMPFTTGAVPLSRFDRLCLRAREYHYLRMVEVKYELTLEGDGEELTLLGRCRDYMPVRAMAEEVGRFLGMDVLDATADPPVRLRAEALGKPLNEQPGRRPWVRLDPPVGSSLDAQVGADHAHIALPRQGSIPGLVGGLLLAVSIAGLAVYLVATNLGNGWLTVLFLVGVAGLLELAALTWVEMSLPRWILLAADPERLRVTARGLFGSRRTEVAARQIREIRAGDESVTVFCADRAHHFSHGRLSPRERKWIQDVLVYVLGGGEPLSSATAIAASDPQAPVPHVRAAGRWSPGQPGGCS